MIIKDPKSIFLKMKEEELLQRFKEIINMGFVEAIGMSNSAVGMTLERLLDITSNSSPLPDFGEIELKSIVVPRKDRFNKPVGLFSQVPDWERSYYSGIHDFFDTYHYYSNNKRQLFITVNTRNINSIGLKLDLDDSNLYEIDGYSGEKLLIWEIEKLWEKLLIKHSKTFWIFAEKKIIDRNQYFHYFNIEYSANPIKENFVRLISLGEIQLDHCISETKLGKTKERGPSFRIKMNSRPALFETFIKIA